jgi:hypothetical protein
MDNFLSPSVPNDEPPVGGIVPVVGAARRRDRAEIATLKTEVARLGKLVPVAVPADIDKTVALLKGAGPVLEIGSGVKARFGRLGRFVDALKERKP